LKNLPTTGLCIWHFNIWKDLKFVYLTYLIFKNSQDGYISKLQLSSLFFTS